MTADMTQARGSALTIYRPSDVPLPWNHDAEQAVLGAILVNPFAVDDLVGWLEPDDFYLPVHRAIYAAMLALHAADQRCDLVTVAAKARGNGVFVDGGGEAYLLELVTASPSGLNAVHYGRVVRHDGVARRGLSAARAMADLFSNPSLDTEEQMLSAQELLDGLMRETGARDFAPIGASMPALRARVDDVRASPGEISGIPTHLPDLDRLTGGFHPGELVILAGRPGSGKSSLGLCFADHIATRLQRSVGYVSLEMSRDLLRDRLVAMKAGVDIRILDTGRSGGRAMSDLQYADIVSAMDAVERAELVVDDSPGMTLAALRARCRRLHARHDLGLLVVDYLQLMQGAGRESRTQEVAELSRGLKTLAGELGIPILALSQLNRECEKRDDKRPMLSDLAQSGSVEADADIVLLLYRDVMYDRTTLQPHTAEVNVAKNRNGQTATVETYFDAGTMRFWPLQRRDASGVRL